MQKNKLPIILLECANSHGGDKFIFKKTIKKFSKNNYKNLHINFSHLSMMSYPLKIINGIMFIKNYFLKKIIGIK